MRKVSIVVPIKDEQDNIVPLIEQIREAMRGHGEWEAVVVDDGSIDGSFDLLQQQASADPRIKVIRLRRNFGQAAAMQAGIDASTGEVIATMDGDLQNDPSDIPMVPVAGRGWPWNREHLLSGRPVGRLPPLVQAADSAVEPAGFGVWVGVEVGEADVELFP